MRRGLKMRENVERERLAVSVYFTIFQPFSYTRQSFHNSHHTPPATKRRRDFPQPAGKKERKSDESRRRVEEEKKISQVNASGSGSCLIVGKGSLSIAEIFHFFHSQLAFLSFCLLFFSPFHQLFFFFIHFSPAHFSGPSRPPDNIIGIYTQHQRTLRMENKYEYKKKYTRRQTVCAGREKNYSRDSSSRRK